MMPAPSVPGQGQVIPSTKKEFIMKSEPRKTFDKLCEAFEVEELGKSQGSLVSGVRGWMAVSSWTSIWATGKFF